MRISLGFPMSERVPDIVTPCCGEPLVVLTEMQGSGHMTRDVPSEIMCMRAKCFNSWTPAGVSDDWNKWPGDSAEREKF